MAQPHLLSYRDKSHLVHSRLAFLRGLQRDVVYPWLTNSALVYEPKCGGRGGVAGSQPMRQLHTGVQINFEDLTPYVPMAFLLSVWQVVVCTYSTMVARRGRWTEQKASTSSQHKFVLKKCTARSKNNKCAVQGGSRLVSNLIQVWMRSSQVVGASGCQCQRRISPGFDPSILRHSGS
jgi:hypothetical protein